MHSVAATLAHAESRGCGDEKEPSVHDKRCSLSLKDRKTCTCKCGGRLHGSAWKTTAPGGPGVQAVPSRQSNVRRAVAIAVAFTVAGTVGGLAVTGNFSASSTGTYHLSVQVSVDLNSAISALSLLGFGGRRISNSGTSGAGHHTDCAKSTTGQVKKFLTHYPCEQYAANTWAITRQDATAQVAFAWVEMPTTSLAAQYKAVVDTYGTGNPPGVSSAFNGALLRLWPTGFDGLDSGSATDRESEF
jgi:hypothetical protein